MASGPSVEKRRLVIDNRLRDARQRVAALFDRFDQPLRRVDLALDVFAFFGRCFAGDQAVAIVVADVQAGVRRLQPHVVTAVVRIFRKMSGVTVGPRGSEIAPGLGFSFRSWSQAFWIRAIE